MFIVEEIIPNEGVFRQNFSNFHERKLVFKIFHNGWRCERVIYFFKLWWIRFYPPRLTILPQYISVFSVSVNGKFEIKQIIIRKNAAFLFQPSVPKSVTRIAINEFVQPLKPILFWRFSLNVSLKMNQEVGK